MRKSKLTWEEESFRVAVYTELSQRIGLAASWLVNKIKQAVNIPAGTPPVASKPGTPPRRRTGWLRSSITFRISGAVKHRVFRVGAFERAKYSWYLEKGVRNDDGSWRIRPRPHIVATLKANKAKLANIIATGKANG